LSIIFDLYNKPKEIKDWINPDKNEGNRHQILQQEDQGP
jgi:hypothetical protein